MYYALPKVDIKTDYIQIGQHRHALHCLCFTLSQKWVFIYYHKTKQKKINVSRYWKRHIPPCAPHWTSNHYIKEKSIPFPVSMTFRVNMNLSQMFHFRISRPIWLRRVRVQICHNTLASLLWVRMLSASYVYPSCFPIASAKNNDLILNHNKFPHTPPPLWQILWYD